MFSKLAERCVLAPQLIVLRQLVRQPSDVRQEVLNGHFVATIARKLRNKPPHSIIQFEFERFDQQSKTDS